MESCFRFWEQLRVTGFPTLVNWCLGIWMTMAPMWPAERERKHRGRVEKETDLAVIKEGSKTEDKRALVKRLPFWPGLTCSKETKGRTVEQPGSHGRPTTGAGRLSAPDSDVWVERWGCGVPGPWRVDLPVVMIVCSWLHQDKGHSLLCYYTQLPAWQQNPGLARSRVVPPLIAPLPISAPCSSGPLTPYFLHPEGRSELPQHRKSFG